MSSDSDSDHGNFKRRRVVLVSEEEDSDWLVVDSWEPVMDNTRLESEVERSPAPVSPEPHPEVERPPSVRSVVVRPQDTSPRPGPSQRKLESVVVKPSSVAASPTEELPYPHHGREPKSMAAPKQGTLRWKQLQTHPNLELFDQKWRLVQCPLCLFTEGRGKSVKRHLVEIHLPMVLRPQMACWECGLATRDSPNLRTHIASRGHTQGIFSNDHLPRYAKRVFGLIFWLVEKLGLESPQELMGYAIESLSFTPTRYVEPCIQATLATIQSVMSRRLVLPEELSEYNPLLPLSILVNWETVVHLVAQMKPQDVNDFRTFKQELGPGGGPITYTQMAALIQRVPAPFIDAHCHQQETLTAWKVSRMEDLDTKLRDIKFEGTHLDVAIDNACFPEKNWDVVDRADDEDRPYSVSVHPKAVKGPISYSQLFLLAERPSCKGIGECGLDYTQGDHQQQVKAFQDQIEMAILLDKTLTIHCRPKTDVLSEYVMVYEEAAGIVESCLKKKRKASATKPFTVVWHCFMGDDACIKLCTISGCRVFFSLSGKSMDAAQYPWLGKMLDCVDLADTLLETDSPFLSVVAGVPRSAPQMVAHLAYSLAERRGWPHRTILAVTHQNARMAFQL